MTAIADLPPSVWADFVACFRGELLGAGIAREVYALRTDPSKVVKIEMADRSFQNALEWSTWRQLRETKYAKYLAPCHWISPCGIVLIQERARPLMPEHERVRLPSFLTDTKRANYGVINGRVVAVDYGTNLAISDGAFASKLRKPDWWDL